MRSRRAAPPLRAARLRDRRMGSLVADANRPGRIASPANSPYSGPSAGTQGYASSSRAVTLETGSAMVLRRSRARGRVVVVTLALASAHEAIARVLVESRGDSGMPVDTSTVPLHGDSRAARFIVVLAVRAEARSHDTERPRDACRRSGQSDRCHECLQFAHNASREHFESRSVLVPARLTSTKEYVVPRRVSRAGNSVTPAAAG